MTKKKKTAQDIVREFYETNNTFSDDESPFRRVRVPNNLSDIAKNIDRCPFCASHHVELRLKLNLKFNGDRPSGLLYQIRCIMCDGRSPECIDLASAVISWEANDPNVMGDIIRKEWSKNINSALKKFRESNEEE